MLTQLINARILTPQGWLKDGSVLIRDGKILEVTNCDLAVIGAQLIDVKGMYVLPGGVEIHAHGGGGRELGIADVGQIGNHMARHAHAGRSQAQHAQNLEVEGRGFDGLPAGDAGLLQHGDVRGVFASPFPGLDARPVARPRFSTNQLLMSVVMEMPASVMEPVP